MPTLPPGLLDALSRGALAGPSPSAAEACAVLREIVARNAQIAKLQCRAALKARKRKDYLIVAWAESNRSHCMQFARDAKRVLSILESRP